MRALVSRIEARTAMRPKLRQNEVIAALAAATPIMRVWQLMLVLLFRIRLQPNTALVAKPYIQACCIIRCWAKNARFASMVQVPLMA